MSTGSRNTGRDLNDARPLESGMADLGHGSSLSAEESLLLQAELGVLPPWPEENEAIPSVLANVKMRLEAEGLSLDLFDVRVADSPAIAPSKVHLRAKTSRAAPSVEFLSEAASGDVSSVRTFRTTVNRAVQRYVGDQLMVEVIRRLRKTWDRAAIYLLDSSGTALEVAASSEITAPYTVRYPIRSETPDVVVDVFNRGWAERLHGGGWDERFNRYLYDAGLHALYKERLFVPLILTRSLNDCSMQAGIFKWVPSGKRYWCPEMPNTLRGEVIGTLSLSREKTGADIEEAIAEALRFASSSLPLIAHGATIRGLSEVILADLITRFGASHGALHVGRSIGDVFHEMDREGVTRILGGVGEVPRRDGLGAETVKRRKCIHFGRAALEKRNPRLAGMGVQHTSVGPLFDAQGGVFGLIYLHYDKPQAPREIGDFAEVTGEALGIAMHARRRALSPANLLAEARGFTLPRGEAVEHRLTRMAGFTSNLLGCDHVSIVVTTTEGTRPVHYGRYIQRAPKGRSALNKALLDLCSRQLDAAVHLSSSDSYADEYCRGGFVSQEKIRATAIVPIWGLGFLVIDYRASHEFLESEKELHRALAELIAIGIKVVDRADIHAGEGTADDSGQRHMVKPHGGPQLTAVDDVRDDESPRVVRDLAHAVEITQESAPQGLHLGFELGGGWKVPSTTSGAT